MITRAIIVSRNAEVQVDERLEYVLEAHSTINKTEIPGHLNADAEVTQ